MNMTARYFKTLKNFKISVPWCSLAIEGKTIDMEERFGSVALDIIGKYGCPWEPSKDAELRAISRCSKDSESSKII